MEIRETKSDFSSELESLFRMIEKASLSKKLSKKRKIYPQFSEEFRLNGLEKFNQEIKPENNIGKRLDEIVDLLSTNSLNKNDYHILRGNQLKMLDEISVLREQNDSLLSKVETLHHQNSELKKVLLQNTSDKLLRRTSGAFLVLFTISLLSYYISDYELIKLIWAKFGLLVSSAIYLIGFFVGKLVNRIETK